MHGWGHMDTDRHSHQKMYLYVDKEDTFVMSLFLPKHTHTHSISAVSDITNPCPSTAGTRPKLQYISALMEQNLN